MNSPPLCVQALKKLDRFNATISEFSTYPTWTVAVGAMLISGVQPAAHATKIPEEASQLLDLSLPASSHQLCCARSVMQEWVESHEEDDEAPPPPTPIAFLCWCEEAYRGALHPPELLDYFLRMTKRDHPAPPPPNVVERLLELELHATVERDRPSSAESGIATEGARLGERKHFAKRMEALVLEGRVTLSIAMLVADALDQTYPTGGYQPLRVWGYLLDMAQSGKYVDLKSAGTNGILIPSGHGMKNCSYRALSQFLVRHKEALIASASSKIER